MFESYFNGKPNTINLNGRNLKKFCDWLNTEPETLITEYRNSRKDVLSYEDWIQKTENTLKKYYQYQLTLVKPNSARNFTVSVLAFFKQNTRTQFPNMTKTMKHEIATNEFTLTQSELTRMYNASNLEDKTLISLASNLGVSTLDFLTLESEKLLNECKIAEQNKQAFHVFVGNPRHKTSCQPIHCLIPETMQCVREYTSYLIGKYGKLPKYLFFHGDKTDTHMTNTALNLRIKAICQKTNISTNGKKLTFNLFRKFLYSTIEPINSEHAKYLLGKVNSSNATYSQNTLENVKDTVIKAYDKLILSGSETLEKQKENADKIDTLENTVKKLSLDMESYKTQNEVLTKKISELETQCTVFYDALFGKTPKTNLEQALKKYVEDTTPKKPETRPDTPLNAL